MRRARAVVLVAVLAGGGAAAARAEPGWVTVDRVVAVVDRWKQLHASKGQPDPIIEPQTNVNVDKKLDDLAFEIGPP